MTLQLTLSCDSDKLDSGPVLIHSTGVEHYKIPPEVIRILQENLTNDRLSDHEEGVLCQDGSQRVLDVLLQNGFTLQNQTTEDDKTLWILVQNGSKHERSVHPDNPNDENEADAEGEDQRGNEEEAEGEHQDGNEEEEAGENKEEEE